MPHGPAGGELVALSLRGVGPVVPGIVAGVALVVEIAVVAGILRLVAPIGAEPVQAVVALVGVEAAFGDAHADDGARIDAEPLHALAVGAHVRLADEDGIDAERAQVVAERHLAHFERDAVPGGAVRLHVAAGVEAHARGAAHGRLHVGAREPHTPGCERIDVRGGELGMSVAGQIIPAQLVAHDEEDVAGSAGHGGLVWLDRTLQLSIRDLVLSMSKDGPHTPSVRSTSSARSWRMTARRYTARVTAGSGWSPPRRDRPGGRIPWPRRRPGCALAPPSSRARCGP